MHALFSKQLKRLEFNFAKNARAYTDSHSRGKAVGIEDDVRNESTLREGHVLSRPELREDALLTVSRGELVADDGRSSEPHNDRCAHQRQSPRVRPECRHSVNVRRLARRVLLYAHLARFRVEVTILQGMYYPF